MKKLPEIFSSSAKLLTGCLLFFVACLMPARAAEEIPTGQDSPEGVACDAVKAYINCDSKAWLATLIRPIYGDEGNVEFEKFKKHMVALKDKNKIDPLFQKPKILYCYRARNFSANGPASMAYAMHEIVGNKFVDVVVEMPNGAKSRLRYHVMRDKDKKWYFEPRPDLCEFLAMGLNEESPSTKIWKPKKKKNEPTTPPAAEESGKVAPPAPEKESSNSPKQNSPAKTPTAPAKR